MKNIKMGKRALWRADEADTAAKKAAGIMFRRTFAPLLFEFAAPATLVNSIHSFFCVKFDAVFLDEQKTVTQVETVKSCSFLTPKKPAKYLIEVPAGEAAKKGVKPGARLGW